MGVPLDVAIYPLVETFNLTFNAGQHLLVFAVLFSISFVEPVKEPHDGAADARDKHRHPPRFHVMSLFVGLLGH